MHDVMTRTDIIAAEARAELLPLIEEQAERIAEKDEQLDEQAEQLVEKDKLLKQANAKKIENAQKMIKDNFSDEMIMRYTGLSIEEIKQFHQ